MSIRSFSFVFVNISALFVSFTRDQRVNFLVSNRDVPINNFMHCDLDVVNLVFFPRSFHLYPPGFHVVTISSPQLEIFATQKKWPSREAHGVGIFNWTIATWNKGGAPACITPFVTVACILSSVFKTKLAPNVLALKVRYSNLLHIYNQIFAKLIFAPSFIYSNIVPTTLQRSN